MDITLQDLSAQSSHDLNRCDGAFTVDSKLVLRAENDVISYTVVDVPPYQKRYPPTYTDYRAFLGQLDKAIFFAYVDGELAGQIILFRNWNGYAYIDDIVVDAGYRRRGVGRALINQAIAWAKSRELPGIMLETQNINVAACLFYQHCGFQIGGFDRYLYRGLDADTDEIAIYWYLTF
jgi:ribosomal protein S18 acetylase RimI-like enzyme